jgi:hypothetical protein
MSANGIEIRTLTSFGDKPSGYRMTVPNDIKLVKALEALYDKAQPSSEHQPRRDEVSSLARYYSMAAGAETMPQNKTWPVYGSEAEREREEVENVFRLGGGELEDDAWGGYAYNYEGAPEYAEEIRPDQDLDYQYHTVIVTGGGFLPSPKKKLLVDNVEWELVETFMSSGETECIICGAGGNGIEWWAEQFEKQHGVPPKADDMCGLCETEMEDMPGYVYVGDSYEAVYRAPNSAIWPEDGDEEYDVRGASTTRRRTALPPEDDDGEEGTYHDGDCDSEYQDEAKQAVEESDPANIPDYAYFGDLDVGNTWAHTLSVHRDSDLLGQSNWEVILKDMEEKFPKDVTEERASHWAVGWIDKLMVRMLDDDGCVTPAGEAILAWKDALEDYPIADESHHSEKEFNYALESLPDDITYALRGDEDFEDLDGDDIAKIIEYMLENESEALDYVLEDPMNHAIEGNENATANVKEIAYELNLDWLSKNRQEVIPILKQLARETDMSAEEMADYVAEELTVDPDRLLEIAEQFANPTDPRQQRLPSVASTKRRKQASKHAATTQPPEVLARKIQEILDASQVEWEEALGKPDPLYADTVILQGDEVQRILETDAPVALTYDGAGYDELSYQGELASLGGGETRDAIFNAAAELGYMTEDQNTWSMTFWPDEGVQPRPKPKRETPQWLKDQLRDEFGADL